MSFVRAFLVSDMRNIRRDSLLAYLLLMPFLIAFMLRFVVPSVAAWLATDYGFSLQPYYVLIVSFFVVLEIPLIFGLVFGLLLLDERDDRMLMAIQVTPVSVDLYVLYRFIATVMLSILYVVAALPLTGLIKLSLAVILLMLPSLLLGGLFAVMVLLFLIVFANNKVEGLAIMKAFGILMLGPLAAYFISPKWQLAVGILPSYWPAKVFWSASDGIVAWGYIAAGTLYLTLISYLLFARFRKKLTR